MAVLSTFILPVYLVIDVSASMASYISVVNRTIASIVGSLETEPIAAHRIRLSIISFSDEAEIVLAMARVDEIGRIPELSIKGGTSYGPALELLCRTITLDIGRLKADGYRVARPTVFFLTDGQPSDRDWLASLKPLLESNYRPTLLAFGVGAADPATLVDLASRPEFALIGQRQVEQFTAIRAYGSTVEDYFRSLSRSTQANSAEVTISVDPIFSAGPSGFQEIDNWI
jgi:uncharacterized protein YegL